MDEARAKELSLICIAWGPPKDGSDHMDCPVFVAHESQVTSSRRQELGKLPALCECDCLTCKRAWWDMGRPMQRDGKIVTSSGKPLA